MIKGIISDIEGTLTPVEEVRDTLYPHARSRLEAYVREHAGDDEMGRVLDDVRHRLRRPEAEFDDVLQQLLYWFDEDRHTPPLKQLLARLCEQAAVETAPHAHLHSDVIRALEAFQGQGIRFYTFSRTSVYAQRLLFVASDAGDLSRLITDFFDTDVGSKTDPTAYQSIATLTGLNPSEVLVVSDSAKELDAARQVGMHTAWMVRDGPLDLQALHQQIGSLDELDLR